jgi:inorganic pyrophosphatase
MPNFINLPPFTEDGDVHVVVETPRGSRAKFAYDPKLDSFILSKSLLTGLSYPHDWGFVPSTTADDGDPLDIMVIHDAATFPGIVLTCRIIGILQIVQKSKGKAERNDRLFAVPRRSHAEQGLRDVQDLSKQVQQELEKFFIATDELEDRKLEVIGWKGPKIAMKAARRLFRGMASSSSHQIIKPRVPAASANPPPPSRDGCAAMRAPRPLPVSDFPCRSEARSRPPT